jgi:HEAT repeat protein
MVEIRVTLGASGEAYVALAGDRPPEVRDSVALDALAEAEAIPALDNLVLDFDHYGRLVGLRVTDSADSILAPSLIDAAQSSA